MDTIYENGLEKALTCTLTVCVCVCVCFSYSIKGIVHFEINFWYVLSYLKGIQDVAVIVSMHSVFNFDIFRSNRSCLSVI